jgi:hypothetical protein
MAQTLAATRAFLNFLGLGVMFAAGVGVLYFYMKCGDF